jgi:hypothetical protein
VPEVRSVPCYPVTVEYGIKLVSSLNLEIIAKQLGVSSRFRRGNEAVEVDPIEMKSGRRACGRYEVSISFPTCIDQEDRRSASTRPDPELGCVPKDPIPPPLHPADRSTHLSPLLSDRDSLLDPTPSQRSLLAGVGSSSLQLGLFLLLTLLEGLVVFVELDLFLLGRLEGFELWVKKSGLRGEQSSSVQGDGGW